MEDVAGDPVVAPAEASANTVAATTSVDVSTDPAALLLVSVKPTTTLIADDADREIVRRLHPIVYKVEPYEDTESLCKDLNGVEFLQQSSLIASAPKEDILDQLETIFADARIREAEKVEVVGDVATDFRIAAIEIRHAILHCNLDTIDAESGMMIYSEGVADVQNPGNIEMVVIRREDKVFWERCIALSENDIPVCGVGNTGIGKTTTTIYLLQRLINQNKPVVYTIRKSQSMRQDDIFYEFVPDMDEEEKVKDVTVKVYKMSHEEIYTVPVLQEKTAVYVVDPGDFDGSCGCSGDLRGAHFIMNASNDQKHWGGSNFGKLRKGIGHERWKALAHSPAKNPGKLIHGFLWTGHQLLVAKKYLKLDLNDDDLLRRFRIVGGSIRDILEFNESAFKDTVKAALNIDDLMVQGLVEGAYQFSYKPSEPSSVLVGLSPSDSSLEIKKIVLKSDYVEEQLAKKHFNISWYAFLNEDNAGNRGNVFESYLREKFSSAAISFPGQEVRESLRTKPANPKSKKEIKNYQPVADGMTIGSERIITRVSNMNERVQTDDSQQYVFYSKNEAEALIDMIWRVDNGYDSVQSTVGPNHSAARGKIQTLKTELHLKDEETLRIFFTVPACRYKDFVTDPVNPLYQQEDLKNVRIFHVSV
uniref:Uncharacterized protein n=1 Tax=Attheya septentrionalis TaxID=420275 RepID=A0A7S2UDW3_9STRA|mmetsp:Transcript_19164/g.34758  ORF Transcript_19164/g.34758 Transcript_19164/m.34758 type:complete len:647 (+) Transcript_19164:415-2355(+)|eukprot:CAMPEP_0198291148 /NCGR_PEP_ID=MMETSP1449-20131203/8778_1 /TAXON_ID=420275 /ORGANISM="Attheya septentrionalis, Strain CCMP2084" /LENGTH=646 /DNA_ID=CAMNT_0043989753 /DNA_START=323 /DNA_END=2263 /DNA_ORIENTATION=-